MKKILNLFRSFFLGMGLIIENKDSEEIIKEYVKNFNEKYDIGFKSLYKESSSKSKIIDLIDMGLNKTCLVCNKRKCTCSERQGDGSWKSKIKGETKRMDKAVKKNKRVTK